MSKNPVTGQLAQEKSSDNVIEDISATTLDVVSKEISKILSDTDGVPKPPKYTFGSPVSKLCYEENFLLQLYVKDVYGIIDNKKGLAEKISKKHPTEGAFMQAALNYINDRYYHLMSVCSKDPNRIHSGYKVSYNAYRNLLSFLHNDELVKKGFYESINQRYYTCFKQYMYLWFDSSEKLLTMDYDLIVQESKNYFAGPNNIDYAVKYHAKDVINEIAGDSDVKHRYCTYTFDEYKTI